MPNNQNSDNKQSSRSNDLKQSSRSNDQGRTSTAKKKSAAIGAAGVAGAVIGAGVAVAATAVLADKNKREQIKKGLTQVKDKVVDTVHTLEEKEIISVEGARNKFNEAKKNLESPKKQSSGSENKSDSTSKTGLQAGA